jgi:hypothetical protein
MSIQPSTRPTARNPKTLAKFRRESWWQITFPMLVLVLLLLGGIVGLFFWQGKVGVAVVADYSLILLILPMLVVGLIALAAVIGLVYVVGLALHWLPPYAYIAHKKTFDVRDRVVGIANRITGMIITVRSVFDGFWHFLTQRGIVPETQSDAQPGRARKQP